MKCCICNNDIKDIGNNPYPLCGYDDFSSRCCDTCNALVLTARLLSTKYSTEDVKEGSMIALFYSNNSNIPIEYINENKKFITGRITKIEQNGTKELYYGTWGNYAISRDDSFAIVEV